MLGNSHDYRFSISLAIVDLPHGFDLLTNPNRQPLTELPFQCSTDAKQLVKDIKRYRKQEKYALTTPSDDITNLILTLKKSLQTLLSRQHALVHNIELTKTIFTLPNYYRLVENHFPQIFQYLPLTFKADYETYCAPNVRKLFEKYPVKYELNDMLKRLGDYVANFMHFQVWNKRDAILENMLEDFHKDGNVNTIINFGSMSDEKHLEKFLIDLKDAVSRTDLSLLQAVELDEGDYELEGNYMPAEKSLYALEHENRIDYEKLMKKFGKSSVLKNVIKRLLERVVETQEDLGGEKYTSMVSNLARIYVEDSLNSLKEEIILLILNGNWLLQLCDIKCSKINEDDKYLWAEFKLLQPAYDVVHEAHSIVKGSAIYLGRSDNDTPFHPGVQAMAHSLAMDIDYMVRNSGDEN